MLRPLLSCVACVWLVAACDAEPAQSPFRLSKPPEVRLQLVAEQLDKPVDLTHDGTRRLFVVEQRGRIRLIVDGRLRPRPYLDIRPKVFHGGECGLLGLAFHPRFAENGRFFVNYTSKQPELCTIVSEFTVDPKAEAADPKTERLIIKIDQPYGNHNGGQVKFGPDGYLYIGMGDGGAANDPHDNAQNPDSLLGKMLRIDVNDPSVPYAIPPDNPFVDREGYRPEIWALGLRNPWRFSFDPRTGEMYAGDVGQNAWEEIDLIVKGGNYGWRPHEGLHPTPGIRPQINNQVPPIHRRVPEFIDPIWEYPQTDNNRSVTGGYVYRGKAFPQLEGWYVFGDYASERIWAMKYEDGQVVGHGELLARGAQPSSFGEDLAGEIYVCDHSRGRLFRIVPAGNRGPNTK